MLKRINHTIHAIVVYITITFLFLSCKENRTKDTSQSELHDTMKNKSINVDILNKTSINNTNDSLPIAEYNALIGYFKKENNKIDDKIEIPFSSVIDFMKSEISDTTSTFYSGINPIDIFINKYGSFFLIKLNCTAGGDCAVYYLINFDNGGKFRNSEKVGDVTSEENESRYFKYKLNSDTTLLTYQIRHDNEKDKDFDTIKKVAKLKF
jgi:hypothetical protein